MENCLVTKLKASVNNDNLKKMGVLPVVFKNTGFSASITIGVNSPIATKVVSHDYPLYSLEGDNLGNEYNIPAIISGETRNYVCPGGGKVEIYNKYDLKMLSFSLFQTEAIDAGELKFCNGLMYFMGHLSGKLSDISELTLLQALILQQNAPDSTLVGTLDALSGMTEMINLQITQRKGISGPLSALGPMTKLAFIAIGDTSISGSIEAFVAAQREAGRTTCANIDLPWIGASAVTFNGATIAAALGTKLSWDATTITLDGTTINA